MDKKKAVYIAGPITGVEEYWRPFEEAAEDLDGLGYIPLNPARLPEGMSKAQYMRICFAMIDSADAVLLLGPWWERSEGARLEAEYAKYTGKPVVVQRVREVGFGERNPREIVQAWLRHDLGEVFK